MSYIKSSIPEEHGNLIGRLGKSPILLTPAAVADIIERESTYGVKNQMAKFFRQLACTESLRASRSSK